MKQLVVVSGKGGTGKTTVTAALAHLAASSRTLVLADTDVDAANLELVVAPELESTEEFWSGELAVIDEEMCIACGRCAEVCRFDAIIPGDAYQVDPHACEGCAACFYQCPVDAIRMEPRHSGQWYVSRTRYGPLYHAHLFAGEENSGKLVTLVKQQARLRAMDEKVDLLLVDGPPGIGCPVIAALAGADLALVVTEPTVSGQHDLERIVQVAEHFGVAPTVLINKADLSVSNTSVIDIYCQEHGIPMIGHLPYDTSVTEAMVRGLPITATDGPVSDALHQVWRVLQTRLCLDS